jgi:hypothetical protein
MRIDVGNVVGKAALNTYQFAHQWVLAVLQLDPKWLLAGSLDSTKHITWLPEVGIGKIDELTQVGSSSSMNTLCWSRTKHNVSPRQLCKETTLEGN